MHWIAREYYKTNISRTGTIIHGHTRACDLALSRNTEHIAIGMTSRASSHTKPRHPPSTRRPAPARPVRTGRPAFPSPQPPQASEGPAPHMSRSRPPALRAGRRARAQWRSINDRAEAGPEGAFLEVIIEPRRPVYPTQSQHGLHKGDLTTFQPTSRGERKGKGWWDKAARWA